MTLPEMSVIDTHLPSNTKIRGFTTEQMLAWGKACAEAEREACAQIVDDFGDDWMCDSHMLSKNIRARGNT
jgi:hypothetical protein